MICAIAVEAELQDSQDYTEKPASKKESKVRIKSG